jgi:hypothetical protein
VQAWDAHCDQIRQASREQRIKALEEQRTDFEIEQLSRLLQAERTVWKTLVEIGKQDDPYNRLDTDYRGLFKTLLMLGREIANGPRKQNKPSDVPTVQEGEAVAVKVVFVRAQGSS